MQEKEPGRNDPCPCGSGLKYKKCHALKKAPPVQKKAFNAKVLSTSGQLVPAPQPMATLSGRKITKLTQKEQEEWQMTRADYRPAKEESPLPEPFGHKDQPAPMTEKAIDPEAEFQMTNKDYS